MGWCGWMRKAWSRGRARGRYSGFGGGLGSCGLDSRGLGLREPGWYGLGSGGLDLKRLRERSVGDGDDVGTSASRSDDGAQKRTAPWEEAALRMFSWPSVGFWGLLWAGLELMITGCVV